VKRQIKEICQKYNFKLSRRRGQNFLISEKVLHKIIETADLKKTDLVLEIGAGLGFLTEELAKRAKKVLAVEIDKKLVEILKERLKDGKNGIKILQEDILSKKTEKIILAWLAKNSVRKQYKIVANIPYNITGRILRNFLSFPLTKGRPNLMVLMVQKEVGERIVSNPPKMSRLSVMVQFYSQAEIVSRVKKENFWPRPKVDSVILKLKPRTGFFGEEDNFFQLVRSGFSSPRKYLLNNLFKAGIINEKEKGEKIFKNIGLSPRIRAQELSISDWLRLEKF